MNCTGTPSAPNRHRRPAGNPNPTNHGPQKPARSPAEIEPGQIPTGPEKARHRAKERPYRAKGQAGPKMPYNNSETGPEMPREEAGPILQRSTPGRSDPDRATVRPSSIRPPVVRADPDRATGPHRDRRQAGRHKATTPPGHRAETALCPSQNPRHNFEKRFP